MGASFAFGGAVADTLRRAKYQQRYDLVRPLRRLVIEGLDDPLALASVDAVVPVSSHRDRVRERGMDLPTLLAVAVARHLDRPLRTSLLERTRAIGPLAGRSLEERRREVAGVFEVRPATGIRTVLLVDDVVTTGATFADAARAFAAHRIDARLHAVAATPRHSPEPSPL
jgi:predicted amidophosphoribosyltransferase